MSERRSTRKRKKTSFQDFIDWTEEQFSEFYQECQKYENPSQIKVNGKDESTILDLYDIFQENKNQSFEDFLTKFKPKRTASRKLFNNDVVVPNSPKVKRKQKLQFNISSDLVKTESNKIPPKLRGKKSNVVQFKINVEANFEPPQEQMQFVQNLSLSLSRFLSLKSQKFCIFEWFYPDVEIGFFKNEFIECLKDLNLSHIQKLTRYEWSQIRSSIGKPKRFSANFLKNEREKLAKYREESRLNQLNPNCQYFVYFNHTIQIGKIVKMLENNNYLVKLQDHESEEIVPDTHLMSLTKLKLNIDFYNFTQFYLKLQKKKEILAQIKEMNDLFEMNSLVNKEFQMKYAWLLIQLKDISSSIDQLKIKKINEKSKSNIYYEQSKEKAKNLSLENETFTNSVALLYQIQNCIENETLSKREIEDSLNYAISSFQNMTGCEKLLNEIKELVSQIKNLF